MTNAEEKGMRYLWDLGEASLKNILNKFHETCPNNTFYNINPNDQKGICRICSARTYQ